ncbi:MAG: hypothetical protein ACLFU7_09155 [Armatimonadota bacterium]
MTRTASTLAFIAATLLCVSAAFAQQPLTPVVIDHTPAAAAQDVPEALSDLALPEGAPGRLTEVYAAEEGVLSVHVAWLSGDRYLWRVEFAEAFEEGQRMNLYLDADANAATGRDDGGAEALAQLGPDYAKLTEWMADGGDTSDRGLRTAVDGATLWATIDLPMAITDGEADFAFRITSPAGNVERTAASVPADGPRVVRFEGGAEVGGDLRMDIEQPDVADGVLATRITVTNTGDTERWFDLTVPYAHNFGGPAQWFDSFNFTPHEVGEQSLEYHGTSAVLPLTAAWDGETGVAVAFDPMDWYTEAHAGIAPSAAGHELSFGSRIALIPGEAHTFTFHVFEYDGSLGWRGAFDAYWALFPEVFERARDIDPRFHEASGGGLYRNALDPTDEAFASDLLRRMRAQWEWGYAPAPRPGEWAVTDLSIGEWTRRGGNKSATEESLEASRERIRTWVHDTAEMADVAVAYYMHLKNVEKGLMEQYWSDSYFQNKPIEYIGYYAGVPCWFAYPMANSYGEYMEDAIPLIAERFEPAGMAFDSVFGFIPHWGPSADRSPGTTFENGRAFVGEGIGFAHQMDQVRQQRTGGYRTAMVTNLKLPTLSADAVRTDTALLEFHPMGNPAYRERILRLRMLSGEVMFNWWHNYDPRLYRWIPWDELTADQTLDAFRRLRDDILIHSLYYGGAPNGRFAAGIPKVMKALPMLIDIADRGWRPVISAEPAASDLLISRFGEGPTLALGVGNQGYEAIDDQVIIDREQATDAGDAVLMDWSGERTVTNFGDSLALDVSVPARDIRGFRTVMHLPAGAVEQAVVSGDLRDHEPSQFTMVLESPEATEVPVTIWLPDSAMEPSFQSEGCVRATSRGDDGMLRAHLSLQQGRNTVVVSWQPNIPLVGDRGALLNYAFVDDGQPNCNVVAAGDTDDLAFRVQEYFREYYRWAVDDPQTVKLPIVSPEQAPDGRRVVIGLIDELPLDLQADFTADADGFFGVSGDVVYATAKTPEMLEKAVEGLLSTLDERYEWWGPYYPTQSFFRGDPSNAPEALQQAGMAGKTLTGDDTGSLREVTDLPDLIEW